MSRTQVLPERLAGWGLQAAWRISGAVPERLLDATLRRVADATWHRSGRGVLRLEANLARAVPDADDERLRALSRTAMRSYLRYWGEAFALPRWSPTQVVQRIVTHDEHHLREPLAAGRGVSGSLPHMGNWDLAGAWACLTGAPVTTVAERLRPERLYEEFVAFRESLGMTILPLTGGQPPLVSLQERLSAGGFVPLLGDRDLSRHGVEVPLLGAAARLPVGPALLARRTGAALVPMSTSYGDDGRLHVWFQPEVDVGGDDERAAVHRATAQVADAFSTAIRRDPADWHMLQRVFADDLDPTRDPRRPGGSG